MGALLFASPGASARDLAAKSSAEPWGGRPPALSVRALRMLDQAPSWCPPDAEGWAVRPAPAAPGGTSGTSPASELKITFSSSLPDEAVFTAGLLPPGFNFDPRRLEAGTGLAAAQLSRAAYAHDRPYLHRVFEQLGYTKVVGVGVEAQHLQAFVAGGPGKGVAVVFRGTEPESLSNILLDLQADLRDVEGGKMAVHRGFYVAHQLLEKAGVAETIKTMKTEYPGPELFTGHSLGGALATLAARERARVLGGSADLSVITFGSPKVGDARWAADYDGRLASRTVKYSNGDDFIARWPEGAYRHVAASKSVTVQGGSGMTSELARRLPIPDLEKIAKNFFGIDARSLWTHMPDGYVRGLLRAACPSTP